MSPWLVSARFDIVAFTLPALLALLVGSQSSRLTDASGETPTWAWLLFVVLIDVAHVHATTLRVYCDARELRRRPWLYAAAPIAGFVLSVLLYAHSAALFWRCLAYLAVFHFVRQQLGWMRMYRRREARRTRLDAQLDELAIYAATVCPVIVWHTRLPGNFAWFMPGDFAAGLPPAAADAALLTFALCALTFYARQAQRALRGEPVAWGKLLLFTTSAAIWWIGIVVIANDFAFTVTNVVAHGVPYMLISQRVARTQQQNRWYTSSLAGYLLALCALAVSEEWLWDAFVWHEHATLLGTPNLDLEAAAAILVPLLSLPQLTHYILDAYLWRLDGTNPAVSETFASSSAALADSALADTRGHLPVD